MPDCNTARKISIDAHGLEPIAKSVPVSFRPIWNVKKNYLCGYIIRPTGTPDELQALDAESRDAILDLGMLTRTAQALAELQARGEKSVVVVPVGFNTLNLYPWRGHYLSLLRRIPEEVRSFIVLKLNRIPQTAPKERLQTIQRDVSDLCRALAFKTDLLGAHLDSVVRGDVHACALTLPENFMDGEDAVGAIARFAGKVSGISCVPMVDGVDTRAALCAAVSAGYGYLSGKAVMEDLSDLGISRREFSLSTALGAED